jgi:hypothetical protein
MKVKLPSVAERGRTFRETLWKGPVHHERENFGKQNNDEGIPDEDAADERAAVWDSSESDRLS